MRGCCLLMLLIMPYGALAEEPIQPRKIVLIAGKKSHGPGAHDYERTMRLFKVMLDNSNIADRLAVEIHEDGWPTDERTLTDADSIVFYSDGRDGDKYSDAPFVAANRMALLQKQMARGCGLMTMHFSTFVTDEQGKSVLDWVGGYFDWEGDAGQRNWYSKISQVETLELASREHAIGRGVPRMVQLRDEVYWKLRFKPDDKRRSPIWRAIDVFDDEAGIDASTVAWSIEREDGGRGFGTSVGHAYRLWEDEGVRRLFMNAIAWTAKVEIPTAGVETRYFTDDEVHHALAGTTGTGRATVEAPLRVLLFTGNKAHAWHNGAASTAKVKAALEADGRIQVDVSSDIEELANRELTDYAAVVLNNYANWHDPHGIGEAARQAFVAYLKQGGGLVVIHFANGAFHYSLPEAGASDWPEYRRIVRRVWDHHGRAGAKSAHDAFGTFEVKVTAEEHPITAGLKTFKVTDELYYHQAGEEPIKPLVSARSKNTSQDEPLAWTYTYEQARVFQTLLGHSDKTYDSYEAREMLRRAIAWVAHRKIIPLPPDREKLAVQAVQPTPAKKTDHWGIEGVGFKWREEDSRDDRWKEVQIGRFLASSLPLGTAAGTVTKGLSIRLGDQQQATVCYDTASGKLRGAWSGGFLKFTSARFGLIMPPLIDGEPQFLAKESPSWDATVTQYLGLRLLGERVILRYLVDGVLVEESPWIEQHDEQFLFSRQIEVAPADKAMSLCVASKLEENDTIELLDVRNQHVAVWTSRGKSIAFLSPGGTARWNMADSGDLCLTLPARKESVGMPIVFGACDPAELPEFVERAQQLCSITLDELRQAPKKPLWPQEIITRGHVAANDSAYVVDTISLPFDNPYRALFFTSGHDVVERGAMAVCTVHGDVWLVRGVDEQLKQLHWKRFATGLFQPLGLVAKPDGIYVLGRDQITRLRDEDRDGEADCYDCFSNKLPTSPGGHDYTTCLETDEAGNFYFITAHQGIWRMSADGKRLDNIASGLRNPNGLGVGPGPIITAAPQEGNWTPASYIAEAKPGDYFGFGGPKVTPDRPLGWSQPLCFIPRRRDNSSGGQVWVTSDRWGPLEKQLLHFSYGQCRQMLVLREVIEGQAQGGTVDMPLLFDSGAMRGRFNPHDGQLYVSGLRGWTTAATQDGCLQRVRYTGMPANMPVKFRTMQNGVAISFSDLLDKNAAEDLANYHLEQWNYRYAESYGSPDFKPSDPKLEGHDAVRVKSATLLTDGRTVFLEIADLKPVHQLTIGYALKSAADAKIRQTIAYTIHKVNGERMDESLLRRSSVPGRLTAAEEQLLQPGLLATFEQQNKRDVRTVRMAAFYIGNEEPPSGLLEPGPFRLTLSGYLDVPLPSEVRLSLAGNGNVAVELNERIVLEGDGDMTKIVAADVQLKGGYNRLTIRYDSPTDGSAQLRLFWQGSDFAREPIPPTLLKHRSDDSGLQQFAELRHGAQLIERHQCRACHLSQGDTHASRKNASLAEMSRRLKPAWLAASLLQSHELASPATMPRFFEPTAAKDRQAAADVAVWLASLKVEKEPPLKVNATDEELIGRGTTLYEQLNCVACHRMNPPSEGDAYNRSSLYYLAAKFSQTGLLDFLTAGHSELSLRLTEAESLALAAYLLSASAGELKLIDELATADIERGRTAFNERHCGNCHSPAANLIEDARRPWLAMIDLKRGCLAEANESRGQAPAFAWKASERVQVVAYLRKYTHARRAAPLIEQAAQLVTTLRCQACHNRDGRSGARLAILNEESETGQLPEQLPDLTWTGEKLQTTWLMRQLAGELTQPTREWIKGRMPSYTGHAQVLSKALATEHGLLPGDDQVEAPVAELVAQGQLLTLKQNLDCRQCHAMGTLQPTGDEKTKLAPGINFALIKDRLRPAYYRRFVLDPPRVDPSTRMIKLAADGRTTKITSIYRGDAAQQFEALWHYIQTVQQDQGAK